MSQLDNYLKVHYELVKIRRENNLIDNNLEDAKLLELDFIWTKLTDEEIFKVIILALPSGYPYDTEWALRYGNKEDFYIRITKDIKPFRARICIWLDNKVIWGKEEMDGEVIAPSIDLTSFLIEINQLEINQSLSLQDSEFYPIIIFKKIKSNMLIECKGIKKLIDINKFFDIVEDLKVWLNNYRYER